MSEEPQHVQDARRVIREWELRDGHDAYTACLGGSWDGFQASCWDCGWRGTEYLRGDEEMGTKESCAHKQNARREATEHRQQTIPASACAWPPCSVPSSQESSSAWSLIGMVRSGR